MQPKLDHCKIKSHIFTYRELINGSALSSASYAIWHKAERYGAKGGSYNTGKEKKIEIREKIKQPYIQFWRITALNSQVQSITIRTRITNTKNNKDKNCYQ